MNVIVVVIVLLSGVGLTTDAAALVDEFVTFGRMSGVVTASDGSETPLGGTEFDTYAHLHPIPYVPLGVGLGLNFGWAEGDDGGDLQLGDLHGFSYGVDFDLYSPLTFFHLRPYVRYHQGLGGTIEASVPDQTSPEPNPYSGEARVGTLELEYEPKRSEAGVGLMWGEIVYVNVEYKRTETELDLSSASILGDKVDAAAWETLSVKSTSWMLGFGFLL